MSHTNMSNAENTDVRLALIERQVATLASALSLVVAILRTEGGDAADDPLTHREDRTHHGHGG